MIWEIIETFGNISLLWSLVRCFAHEDRFLKVQNECLCMCHRQMTQFSMMWLHQTRAWLWNQEYNSHRPTCSMANADLWPPLSRPQLPLHDNSICTEVQKQRFYHADVNPNFWYLLDMHKKDCSFVTRPKLVCTGIAASPWEDYIQLSLLVSVHLGCVAAGPQAGFWSDVREMAGKGFHTLGMIAPIEIRFMIIMFKSISGIWHGRKYRIM